MAWNPALALLLLALGAKRTRPPVVIVPAPPPQAFPAPGSRVIDVTTLPAAPNVPSTPAAAIATEASRGAVQAAAASAKRQEAARRRPAGIMSDVIANMMRRGGVPE